MYRLIIEEEYIDIQVLNEEGKIYKSFLEYHLTKEEIEVELNNSSSELYKKVIE